MRVMEYMQVVVRGHLLTERLGEVRERLRGGGARVTTEIHLSRRITKTVGIYLACRVGTETDGWASRVWRVGGGNGRLTARSEKRSPAAGIVRMRACSGWWGGGGIYAKGLPV